MISTVGIGLLGCGTVGSAFAARLLDERAAFEARAGIRCELRAIAVRDRSRVRNAALPAHLFTSDLAAVVADPRIDLIVECIGGSRAAVDAIEFALDRGRSVVTANKAALGLQGPRLRALAGVRGAALLHEAAVCAGVPVLRVLDALAAGDEPIAVAGIVNGTTNVMLSMMEDGAGYDEALAFAQASGFAESDPSDDVCGTDAAHKLAIVIQRAFGAAVITPRLRTQGITGITQRDVARAAMLGYRIRLIAAAQRHDGVLRASVAPVLIAADHPFACVRGAETLLYVRAREAGLLAVGGPGAGGAATASAVLADTVTALRAINQRHDLGRSRTALDPTPHVGVLFDALRVLPELPNLRVWDDALLHAHAPVSRQHAVLSSPGKDHHLA